MIQIKKKQIKFFKNLKSDNIALDKTNNKQSKFSEVAMIKKLVAKSG